MYYFDIFQYGEDGTSSKVGYWNLTGGPFLQRDLLLFKDNPNTPISVLEPATTESFSSFWPTFVLFLAAIGILISIIMMLIFTIHHDSRVVKDANLLWLYLFFGSICLLFFYSILSTFKATDVICWIIPAFGYLGFASFLGYSVTGCSSGYWYLLYLVRSWSKLSALWELWPMIQISHCEHQLWRR